MRVGRAGFSQTLLPAPTPTPCDGQALPAGAAPGDFFMVHESPFRPTQGRFMGNARAWANSDCCEV